MGERILSKTHLIFYFVLSNYARDFRLICRLIGVVLYLLPHLHESRIVESGYFMCPWILINALHELS